MKTLTPYLKGRPKVTITYLEKGQTKTDCLFALFDDTVERIKNSYKLVYPARKIEKIEIP
jgi:hypothetical protein